MRLAALLLAGALAGSASADLVVLDNGNQFEGKAIEEGDQVVIEMSHGRISVPKERVVRIVRQETPVERFARFLAELDPRDPAAHWGLAEWAREQGLTRERRRALELVLALDPDHPGARKALGWFRHDGRWMTEDEYMAARGFIKDGQEWISPEELERRRVDEAVAAERARWQSELARQGEAFARREAELVDRLRFLETEVARLQERLERRPLVIKRFIQVPVPVPAQPVPPGEIPPHQH